MAGRLFCHGGQDTHLMPPITANVSQVDVNVQINNQKILVTKGNFVAQIEKSLFPLANSTSNSTSRSLFKEDGREADYRIYCKILHDNLVIVMEVH